MKSLSQILPAKRVTMIQALVCFALVLAICAFSFGTVFSLNITVDEELESKVDELFSELPVEVDINFEDVTSIDVSLPFLVKSIGSGVSFVQTFFDILGNADSPDFDMEAANAALVEKLQDRDLINLLVFAVLLILSFGSNIIVGLCNVLLLVATFVLPIIAVISAIRAIFGLLFNTNDMGNAHHKISRALYSVISFFPLLLLIMLVVPEVQFGGAVYAILICCAIGLAINLIASRL
jgi:hypothetical protein